MYQLNHKTAFDIQFVHKITCNVITYIFMTNFFTQNGSAHAYLIFGVRYNIDWNLINPKMIENI